MNGIRNWLNRILHRANILNQDNRQAAANHQNPASLARALESLHRANILNQDNRQAAANHQNPDSLAWALSSLHRANILNQDNRQAAANHQNPDSLARALESLHRANILNQDNRQAAANHQNPDSLARALESLHRANLLNQDNFTAAANHQNPYNLAWALESLHRANILNQDNRQAAANHQNPEALARALESLHRANILNQDNFTALLNSPALTNTQPNIFERIPNHLMNQNVFNDLLGLANNNAIQGYVNRLLGVNNNPNFNDQQSTHRASVHKSVSELASNLARRYPQVINNATAMESEIKKLKDAVWVLPENTENNAAKRCIEKITAHEYTFTDPASRVSLRQLLALAYVAVNDETSRNGTLEDAINSLAKGLYEIQRGYNLNDQAIDQGGDDRPICTSGTFNKIIETRCYSF